MLAALGRWSCRRRRLLVLGWAVLFVLGIVVGGQVFAHLKDSHGASQIESVRGYELMNDARTTGPSLVALISGRPVTDPGTRAAVLAAKQKVSGVSGVTDVVTAYDSADRRLRARDGQASLIVISVHKVDGMPAIHRQVDDVRTALHNSVPAATVRVGGELAVTRDQMSAITRDLYRGELIALPVLLVALAFVFRGWRVALIPLGGALVTVAGALLLLLATTTLMDVGSYAVDVVVLFGIALAVDYSLLMVNRFGEERAAGADLGTATARTTATAGRTIAFSALTVISSLAGLFVIGDPTFTSLALGGIATVLVALFAGLTLIPALLAHCANNLGRVPRQTADDGFFGRLAHRVQRRPLLVASATAALLLALATPFLSVQFGNGDPRVLPRSSESRQVAGALLTDFPGKQADPVIVVGTAPTGAPAVAAYADKIDRPPGVAAVGIEPGLRGNVSAIDVVPAGSVESHTAQQLVSTLRAQRPAYQGYVTRQAAFLVDFEHRIATRLPYALALIIVATFVLLFLMTGSVLVPIKALIMNILSLGATFSALVWVFQDGHLSGLLGFDSFGAVEVWVPIVVFVFAFGLSMDYEVFLLSRIKECHDECGNTNRAVANGLQRSGRIITSAAALVLIVFLGFAAGHSLGIKEMGLALAIAVLVDATLVRCLLVPATMTVLGDANWWAPRPLRQLYERYGLPERPTVIDLTVPREPRPSKPALTVATPRTSNDRYSPDVR